MQRNINHDENYSDATLITLINNNDSDAFELMCARYMGLISNIASKYRYCAEGYDLQDFIQEGLIGLLSACKTYNENGGMTFRNYAMLCVENRYRSIYRHENKKAQVPSSFIVPIDDSVRNLEDTNALSMQEILEHKEYIKSVFSNIEKTLSELEKKVLELYLYGYSYKQISTALSVSEKAISNALCRIRRKLSK